LLLFSGRTVRPPIRDEVATPFGVRRLRILVLFFTVIQVAELNNV